VKLVVGLGNPGRQYAESRHNVGWMALDRLAERSGWSGRARERDAAAVARGRIGDLDLILAKPLTYMNESGIAVRKLLARDHVPLTDLLVVVDDFALPFGKMRVRAEGAHGGHNGLRSIVAELETQRFARLRIGIGEPDRNAVDHVLSRFTAEERRLLPDLLDAAADAIEDWAARGSAGAANRWNSWQLEATRAAAMGPGVTAASKATPGAPPAPGEDSSTEGQGASPGGNEDAGLAGGAARTDAPAPGEIGGPPGSDGIRRTRTGWRRILGGPPRASG
jgi:PTH1 family peptidyl-tRNA hydrolase